MIFKQTELTIDYSKISPDLNGLHPVLQIYIPNDSADLAKYMPKRPSILIFPGGAYRFTSEREAEPIALFYLSKGYNCFVLRYSCPGVRFPVQLAEAGKALLTIKENAEEWRVDTDRIFVCGFSAGGHLAASLGVFWDKQFLSDILGTTPDGLKFKALILGYPVITARVKNDFNGIRSSFHHLLGEKENDEQALEYQCLEDHVSEKTPPCFIWHTCEDIVVPVEDSLLFALALRKHNVPVELHVFQHGKHGQSTGTRICCSSEQRLAEWIETSHKWIDELDGSQQQE